MGYNAGPAPTATVHEFTCKTCGCQALAYIHPSYEWPDGVSNLECVDCMMRAATTGGELAAAWQNLVDVVLTTLGIPRLVAWLARQLKTGDTI